MTLAVIEASSQKNPAYISIDTEDGVIGPGSATPLRHESPTPSHAPGLHGWMDMCFTIGVDFCDGNVG
jgi:hypothetical protein